ncbi:hypothetical protein RIF29_20535 [Crotalaria pallida]|uniref:Uncharacterized protein n=1 Tax=Crotalaria pallida TaxID=3830 RepID=A0AAN9F4P8_CROPI
MAEEEGMLTVLFEPMRGDMVLISFTNEEVFETLYNGSKAFFDSWFSGFVEWSPDLVCQSRDAWLRVIGAPLHARTFSFFTLLTAPKGEQVKIHPATVLIWSAWVLV